MSSKILLRRGTAAQWSSANPILGIGELGIETDTLKIKIGNGTSTWTQLTSYANVTPSQLTSEINNLINAAPSTLDTLNELAAAINNDASFSTTVNNLLTGKVSKSGGDTITASTSSTVGLIVKAAASQTANLQEWQNSSGVLISSLSSGGTFTTTGRLSSNGSSGARLDVSTAGAATVGATIKGHASQTANLQEWQDSSGNILSTIASNGSLRVTNISSIANTGAYTNHSSDSVTIIQRVTTAPNLIIKAFTSQTANLQEWQNVSGTVLAKVDKDGLLTSTGINATGATSVVGTANFYANGNVGITNTLTVPYFNNSYIGTVGGSAPATNIPLTVKGATSQSADLQQWVNNGGTALAKISAYGDLTIPDARIAVGSSSLLANTMLFANTAYSTYTPIVVRGASGQTADLQQWQNNSGGVLAKTDTVGSFTGTSFNASGYVSTNSSGGTYTGYWCKLADLTLPYQYTDANMYMDFYLNGPGFTYVARGRLFVRVKQQSPLGSAPEAPTIVVYNGEGTGFNATDFVLVAVQNDSSLTKYELYYKLPYDWSALVYNPTSSVGLVTLYKSILPIATLPSGTKTYGRNSDGKFNSVLITPDLNNTVNLIVKPVAGQSYNLTEWQNSSGSIISYVTSSGAIASGTAITATSFVKSGGTGTQFLKADGSVDSTSYLNPANSYIAGHHPESRYLANAALMNDLGNARLRGSVFTLTNVSLSDSQIDLLFDGTASFAIFDTTVQTFPMVIEFTLPRTLSWGAQVGVGFGMATWRANSVKIEAFSNGAWVTCIDTTTNTSEDILVGIPGSNSSGTTKLRYTFANPNSTQFRIAHIWGFNYNSDMWTHLQMPRAGGTMYGSLAVQGYTQTLGSTNVVQNVIKGAASQTANLQEWQNSAGTVIAKVDSIGKLSIIQPSGTTGDILSLGLNGAADLIRIGYEYGTSYIRPSVYGQFQVQLQSPNYGFVIKGATSQTGDLQQWQNVGGTVLANIDPNGQASFKSTTLTAASSGGSALTLVAASGQTAPLLSTAGGAKITAAGNYFEAPGIQSNYIMDAYAGAASVIPLKVHGYASQTADLQQWTNNSNTVLAYVDKDGRALFNSLVATYGLTTSGGLGIAGGATTFTYSDPFTGIITNAGGYSATAPLFVVRSANALAAGNLQEWQNSSGTVLASMEAAGFLRLTREARIAQTNAGEKALVLRGASAQTANLQEWQNSAGTVLSKISAGGQIIVTGDSLQNFQSVGASSTLYNGFTVSTNTNAAAYAMGTAGSAETLFGVANSFYIYDGIAGAMRFKIMPTGLVGINSFSPAAQLQITSSSASTPGLLVKAAASQTASIIQWQNSSGTIIGEITNQGIFRNTYNYVQNLQGLGGGSGLYLNDVTTTAFNTNAAHIVFKVQGFASQTANLQEWQNSDGTVLAKIDAAGKLTSLVDGSFNGVRVGLGNSSVASNLAVGYNALNANTTGDSNLAIGTNALSSNTTGFNNVALGQNTLVAATTANSSVAIGRYALSSVTTGSYNTGVGSASLNNTTTGQANVAIGVGTMYSNVTGGANVAIGNTALASNTGSYLNVAIGDGAGYSATGAGNIFIGYNAGYNETGANKLYIANSNISTPLIGGDFSAKTLTVAGNTTITSQATGTAGLIVKGAASQTADLQQWQNSAGEVQVSIKPTANLTNVLKFTEQYSFTINWGNQPILSTSTGELVISPYGPERAALIVKGLASQTDNLQEWQNSAGTMLAKVDANGSATFTGSASTNAISAYAGASGNYVFQGFNQSNNLTSIIYQSGEIYSASNIYIQGAANYSASVNVKPGSTSTSGIVVRGLTSQSADLQQWQNVGGTVLAKITASGALDVTAITVNGAALAGYSAPTIGSTSIASGATVTTLAGLTSVSSTSFVGALTGNASTVTNGVYTNAANIITAASSTTIPIITKAAASQTADLQQWQNSAGDVVSAINSSGFFDGNSVDLSNFGQLYQVGLIANQVSVVVSGATSQTADLQEWRSNQSSAAVAKIDVNGNFKGGLVYDINNQTGTSYTFVLSDSKAVVTLNNANNITASVPTNSTAFPIGSSITVIQYGQGQVTIQALTPGTTTIISNAVTPAAPRLRGILSSATLIKMSAEGWLVIGDIY